MIQATTMSLPVADKQETRNIEEFTPDEITEQHGRNVWGATFGRGAGVVPGTKAGAVQLTGQTWCYRGPDTAWRHTFLRAV
ncbi:hypothetical protein LCGC14_2428520 [marine sediment metagenome]|uniref:Uncharacterized protein n=1 Tax=marine sediment metagenome TaxID=412755 RepID=A0A0F9BMN1_9ZZZZ